MGCNHPIHTKIVGNPSFGKQVGQSEDTFRLNPIKCEIRLCKTRHAKCLSLAIPCSSLPIFFACIYNAYAMHMQMQFTHLNLIRFKYEWNWHTLQRQGAACVFFVPATDVPHWSAEEHVSEWPLSKRTYRAWRRGPYNEPSKTHTKVGNLWTEKAWLCLPVCARIMTFIFKRYWRNVTFCSMCVLLSISSWPLDFHPLNFQDVCGTTFPGL